MMATATIHAHVTVPKLWPSETVVCLGGGPSLTAADVCSVRGNARVIAVNDAHRLAPWADVLYSSDQYWWPHYRGVPEFAGLKYAISPVKVNPEWNITVLRNTGRFGLEIDPSGLRTGMNSGAAAINLAVHFGASRIVLLGYDMQAMSHANSHWFGAHPPGLHRTSPYAAFRAAIGTMVEPLRAVGVEVVNCSRQTAMAAFPRRPLEDMIP